MFEIEGKRYIVDLIALEKLLKSFNNDETRVFKKRESDVIMPSPQDKILDTIHLFLEKVLNENPYESGFLFNDDEDNDSESQEPSDSYKLAFNTLLFNGVIVDVLKTNQK